LYILKKLHRRVSRYTFPKLDILWLSMLELRYIRYSNAGLLCLFIGACLPLFQSSLLDTHWLLCALLICCLFSYKIKAFRSVSFLLAGLVWATYLFQSQIDESFPSEFERQTIQVQGVIIGLPSQQSGNTKFRFLVESANQISGEPIEVLSDKKLLLSCYRCKLDILPDQRWRLSVRLKRPHGFASWGAFDYEKYLFRHQIVAKGYVRLKESNELLENPKQSVHFWRWRIKQRLASLDTGNSVGMEIVQALSIGDKSGLEQSQRAVFQDTGVSHLMAISGLHVGLVFIGVSIIAGWLLFPFARVFDLLPRQHLVLLPALGSAFLYSALAGFAVSTQRALTMLCVYVLCRLFARDVSLFKVLLITVCLIVLVSPWSILDVGFWLSCGAVFIIAAASSKKIGEPNERLALVRLQPILWFGMLPITVLFFGQVSFVSPLVNLVAVPLFCLLLIPLTLVGVIISIVGVADWPLILLSRSFDWVYMALEWVSRTPVAKYYVTEWSAWHWALYVSLVLTFYLRLPFNKVIAQCLIGGSLLLAMISNISGGISEDELEIALLDVGQGLAMVIQSGDYVLVYDTGPKYSTGFTAAEAVLLPFLRARGIKRVDKLIISHADNDHIGGYQSLIDAFDVAQVLTSRVDKLTQAKECVSGQHWQQGATFFAILSPSDDTPKGSNNRSCVLQVRHGKTTVLITGDIEKQVERHLLRNQSDSLAADIMLVPHQGSKTSSTPDFIDAVQPSLAILAAGYRNHYGHPHADVVERYNSRKIDLVSTIDNGTVRLKINKQGWQRESYRHARRRFWHHQKKPNWDG